MFGGILKKPGTESYAISGTLVALAFDCAIRIGAPASTSAVAAAEHNRIFMGPPARASYVAVQPPSTTMSAPVTNDDAGDARNRHAGTTSSGSPNRPSGTCDTNCR